MAQFILSIEQTATGIPRSHVKTSYIFAGIFGITIFGLTAFFINVFEKESNPNQGLASPQNPPREIGKTATQINPQSNPMARIQALRARLDQFPDDRDALMALGNANMMIKRFDEATSLYEHLLKLEPNYLDARTNLALIRLDQGNPKEAVDLLRKNLESSPKDDASLFNLGVIYASELNAPEKALTAWEPWLVQNPEAQEAGTIRQRIKQIKTQLIIPRSGG